MFSLTSHVGVSRTVALNFLPVQTHSQGEPTWSPFFTCPCSDPFMSQNFSSSAALISPWVSSGYLSLHMTARRPEPPPPPPLPQTPNLGWWHHYFTSSSCPKPWSLPSISLLFPSASVPSACPISSAFRPFPKSHCFSVPPFLMQSPVAGVNKTDSHLAPPFHPSLSVHLHTAGRILKM